MNPGDNLLDEAMGALGSSAPVLYRRYAGSTTNDSGYQVSAFEPDVELFSTSVQPVPRTLYERQGLNLSKAYVTWYVPAHVLGVERDAAGDQFTYGGHLYAVESTTDWFSQDGWVAALAVRLQRV